MTDRPFDVLSIGTVYLDINSPNFPFETALASETETVGGSYILTPGGSAMNLARVAAFLDLKPIFVGKIGNDVLGSVLEDYIRKSGITPSMIKSGAVQTNLGLNFINTTGKTVMASVGTANQDLSVQEVIAQLNTNLPQSKFLYLGGYFKLKNLTNHFTEIVALAKQHGTKIILDHGRTGNIATGDERNQLITLIRDVDIYLPSLDELLDVWQAQDLNYALGKVRSVTNAITVVKQAERGATGLVEHQSVYMPAYPVATISTVGAGDSFNAGFIKAHLSGKSLEDSLRFANATAALAISQKTLPTTELVETFLRSQSSSATSTQSPPQSPPPESQPPQDSPQPTLPDNSA